MFYNHYKKSKWINDIFEISWENNFLLIEISWQHSHVLSSLEGEENSIFLVLILWKAKQSAMFLRMILPFFFKKKWLFKRVCSKLFWFHWHYYVQTVERIMAIKRVECYRKWIHNDWVSVTFYFYYEVFYSQPDLKL